MGSSFVAPFMGRRSVQYVKRIFIAMATATVLCVSEAASAIDGVILIDQNKALAGNVTPGDAPGFPVTITQPGSYRLAGNLVAPLNQMVILVAANNVVIDLNGFNVRC